MTMLEAVIHQVLIIASASKSTDYNSLINTALAIFAIASLAGAGIQRGKIKQLREDVADADRRIDALKEEREEDKAKISTLTAEVVTLTTDLDALARVVTGEAHLVALQDMLLSHDKLVQEKWKFFTEVLQDISQTLHRIEGIDNA